MSSACCNCLLTRWSGSYWTEGGLRTNLLGYSDSTFNGDEGFRMTRYSSSTQGEDSPSPLSLKSLQICQADRSMRTDLGHATRP